MLTLNEWLSRWHVPSQAIAELLVMADTPPDDAGATSEASVQARIRVAAPYIGVLLWRNNSGAAIDETGRHIRYGLGNDSKRVNKLFKSPDLVGIKQATGQFVAIECKTPGWKYSENDERAVAQARFLAAVRAAGGIAGFARSVGEFHALVAR